MLSFTLLSFTHPPFIPFLCLVCLALRFPSWRLMNCSYSNFPHNLFQNNSPSKHYASLIYSTLMPCTGYLAMLSGLFKGQYLPDLTHLN